MTNQKSFIEKFCWNRIIRNTIVLIFFTIILSSSHIDTGIKKEIPTLTEKYDFTDLKPGQTITIDAGFYKLDSNLFLSTNGTKDAPITIKANKTGSVVILGDYSIRIKNASYTIIKGLSFKMSPFLESSLYGAVTITESQNIRIHQCLFELDEKNATDNKNFQWLSMIGESCQNNRIDHNLFQNKEHKGDFITFRRKTKYNTVDFNEFRNFQYADGDNTYETIRVGADEDGNDDVSYFITISDNLFYKCNGETEIISFKASDNQVLRNTFMDCHGAVVFRAGNRNTFASNYMIKTDKADNTLQYGGIRIYGGNHKVYNNYFYNLNGRGFNAPLSLMPGAPAGKGLCGSAECVRANNSFIIYNTWIHCSSLNFGKEDSKRTIPPENCLIENNIIYGQNELFILYEANKNTFTNNIVFSTQSTQAEIKGFNTIDPKFLFVNGLYLLSKESPAINQGTQVYSYITKDIHGQNREGSFDIGADEFSTLPVLRKTLTSKEVGPFSLY